jgi:hypothetical protein
MKENVFGSWLSTIPQQLRMFASSDQSQSCKFAHTPPHLTYILCDRFALLMSSCSATVANPQIFNFQGDSRKPGGALPWLASLTR